MKSEKGFVVLLVLFIAAAIASALIVWCQETHPVKYEYVDFKGEKHIAKYCSDNWGYFKQVKPSCSLDDGTKVFDVVSYKILGGEE